MEELKGEAKVCKELGTPTEIPTKKKPGPLGTLTEMEPPVKKNKGKTKAPGIFVADVQLSLHVSPPITGVGIVPELLPVCGSCSPNWAACLICPQ